MMIDSSIEQNVYNKKLKYNKSILLTGSGKHRNKLIDYLLYQ